ncbi:excalibur calcium-binding domain-containing protein [Corynebacterium sp.]|uniref:excalibur calcium-binding domain-containing protein n=1 Tax=Corynebacterium sp. TaxID=1720 RepID=UPI003B3ABA7C
MATTLAATVAFGGASAPAAAAQSSDPFLSADSSTAGSLSGSTDGDTTDAILLLGGLATAALVTGATAAGVTWAVQERLIPNPLPGVIPSPPQRTTPRATAPAPRQTAPRPAVPRQTAPTRIYQNCTAVWNDLHRPIRRGERGYAPHLDRDNDGIGCETRPR